MWKNPIAEMVRRAADAAEAAGIPYAFLGTLSVNVWGVQRPTKDVDLAVGSTRAELPLFIERLKTAGFTYDPVTAHRSLGEFDMVTMGYPFQGRKFPLDLFPAEHWFLRQALGRRVRIPDVPGIGAIFAMSPEDVILFKLLAKHERSTWDSKTVLDGQPGLDRDYVRETAARLHVVDRWQRLLEAVGAGEEEP